MSRMTHLLGPSAGAEQGCKQAAAARAPHPPPPLPQPLVRTLRPPLGPQGCCCCCWVVQAELPGYPVQRGRGGHRAAGVRLGVSRGKQNNCPQSYNTVTKLLLVLPIS